MTSLNSCEVLNGDRKRISCILNSPGLCALPEQCDCGKAKRAFSFRKVSPVLFNEQNPIVCIDVLCILRCAANLISHKGTSRTTSNKSHPKNYPH